MAQAVQRYRRVYINVNVRFDPSGRMIPQTLVWEDGRTYEIDKVLDVRPARADRAGGQGDRYKVRMRGMERELFFEHNPETDAPNVGRWFVEGKALKAN